MRLIDADALFIEVDVGETDVWQVDADGWGTGGYSTDAMKSMIEQAPTIDAVEVKTLEAWLYEIAMNNTNTYLCDACEEIISRLDGLRVFAKELRSHHDSLCDQEEGEHD